MTLSAFFRRGGAAPRAAAAVLCAGIASAPAAAQERPARATVDPVIVETLAETAPVLGRLAPGVQSQVASRIEGVVTKIFTAPGARLSAGDQIAALDPELFQIDFDNAKATLARAEAGVAAAEADVALAKQAMTRAANLRGTTAFSKSQFEDQEQRAAQAVGQLARARAEVAQARSALARAEHDLRHTMIVAPFDGVVIERSAQPGQFIRRGQSAAVLLDPARIEVRADVPTDMAAGVVPGATVTAWFDDVNSIALTVRSLVPRESVSTRTRPVRLTADLSALPDHLLAPGRAVQIEMPVGPAERVLTVSKDALVRSGADWVVMLAVDGKAERRVIEIGRAVGERVVVSRGLAEGDLAVVRGNERLNPGRALDIETRSAPPASAQDPTQDRGTQTARRGAPRG
ncbi:MAG: efflux RND transporter periplasmic adaptor subunit [Pseudomonadota bacterium]